MKRRARAVLPWAAGFALLAGLLWFSDLRALGDAASRARPLPLALSLLATAGSYALGAWLSVVLAHAMGRRLGFLESLPASSAAFAMNNQLSTGGIGGVAIRALAFGRLGWTPGHAAGLSVLTSLAQDLGLSLVLIATTFALLVRPPASGVPVLALGAGALATCAIVWPFALALRTPSLRGALRNRLAPWVARSARRVGSGGAAFAEDVFDVLIGGGSISARDGMKAVALGAADIAARAVCLGLCLTALDVPLPVLAVLGAFGVGTVAGGLSMIPGGMGVADGSTAGMLVLAGLDLPTATTVALVYRLVYFVVPFAVAALVMPRILRAGPPAAEAA